MLVSLGACALLLSGCLRGTSDDASDTMPEGPVADDVLFEQVATLPGVAHVDDLRFQNAFGYAPQYVGLITVTKDADPLCVLDEALALLHQGRRGVGLGVQVVTDDTTVYDVLSLTGREGSAEQRYGPQPTEPQAEATVRPCTAPEGEVSATPTPTR
jgi:hypothetical protein